MHEKPDPSKRCILCGGEDAHIKVDVLGDRWKIECPSCRCAYELTGSTWAVMTTGELRNLHRLGGWIYDRSRLGEVPRIDADDLDAVVDSVPDLTFSEQADRLLIELAHDVHAGNLDRDISLRESRFQLAVHGRGWDEVRNIALYLRDRGFFAMTREMGQDNGTLTSKGLIAYEELTRHRTALPQGFVSMWFDPSMDAVYESIELAVRNAGYRPLKIDKKEHVNKIDDEIIAGIRRSRFVVADYTGNRSNVYYEAGFARGLGITVISTCEEGETRKLSFDVRQYNCIEWNKDRLDVLSRQLQVRIEAILGDGPEKH